jgi:hypothetical protein
LAKESFSELFCSPSVYQVSGSQIRRKDSHMKRVLFSIFWLVLPLALISCAPAAQQPGLAIGRAPADFAPRSAPAATAAPPAEPYAGTQHLATDSGVANAASADRMIVYTVNVSLEVKDAEKAVNDITAIVSQNSGYIAAAEMARDSQGQMRGTLTLRVPAESLDAVQKQIEAVGLKVLSRNRNSNDVTDQYTDLNARLTNLQATEVELRELLTTTRERTGKAEDILAVYNQLTQVRGQIEQIKGQMNVLSKTSAMATLTIALEPQVQVVAAESWIPNQTAREALHALVQALQGLGSLAIWILFFFLPLGIVVVLPFVLVALLIRAYLQRRNGSKVVPQA